LSATWARNGAGKSTTIKMLIGVLTPSAGRLRVAGLDPARQRLALARRIGVVFGQRGPERCGQWRSVIVAGALDEDPKRS
jgi:ABC-type uncharacterized transport system ATPase subunit